MTSPLNQSLKIGKEGESYGQEINALGNAVMHYFTKRAYWKDFPNEI